MIKKLKTGQGSNSQSGIWADLAEIKTKINEVIDAVNELSSRTNGMRRVGGKKRTVEDIDIEVTSLKKRIGKHHEI